jgi:putative DNA primase/helicase
MAKLYPGPPLGEVLMPTVAEVARTWQAAGVSVIPVLDNQSKRPAVRWSPYQAAAPSLGEVDTWWANGREYGLALICGAVSGNLEMTEVEGRAMTSDALGEIINRMDELGVGHVWDLLYGPEGFTEMSPSGGIHFLYRVSDHEVPGNTKIASDREGLCRAETRGHGGYVITAPTTGICHPSGEPWTLREGQYGTLPTISWEERTKFHEALRLVLDESAPTAPSTEISLVSASSVPGQSLALSAGVPAGSSLSPGDDFENRTDWSEILEPHGWQLEHRGPGIERHWTRPGKERRDGASATTGHADDRDRFYVFSTSTQFQSETPYTKFAAFTLLNFGGDYSAAASSLALRGFGDRRLPVVLDELPGVVAIDGESYSLDDMGNGQLLADQVRHSYRWVTEERRWYAWDRRRWSPETTDGIVREWRTATDRLLVGAQDTASLKFAKGSRNISRTTAAINMSKAFGLSHSASEFNPDRHLLNVGNGILDMKTGDLSPHSAEHLMTRLFGADYEPTAACPQFEDFMAKAVPDLAMRSYVQRALGYTLMGDSDQRALFLIFGPSGTGKSTLMEAMREVFGDYGTTAQAGTFRAPKNDKAPTNDLHELRGKRFVSTSETAEGANFDEDLLKRLSGRDRVRSRALYQESQEWVPECTIWVATNNPPKFNSDDNAIWRRTKLIPFTTVFQGDGEVYDFARKVLVPEASGILNWLLVGLLDFLADGLGEPEEIVTLAKEQRAESDSVARFVADELADGNLMLGEDQLVRANELLARYTEWSRHSGERPLGSRRFGNRLASNFPDLVRQKRDGHVYWAGVGRPPGVPIIGAI